MKSSRPGTSIGLVGIATVLENNQLQVPPHQRSFSWRTAEVQELLDDVGAAFKNGEEYFIGSVVLVSPKETTRSQVLDGQQRLATVSLILAAASTLLEEKNDGDRAKAIKNQYLAKYDIKAGKWRIQLKLNDEDTPYFETLVQALDAPVASGCPDSHKRLRSAAEAVLEWVRKASKGQADPVQWLADFVDFLSKDAYVIQFVVPDEVNAFLIFETLNDRGLELSIADLLKNYLLGRAGEDNVSVVMTSWSKTASSLKAHGGEDTLTSFLRHYWSSTIEVVRERDLYKKIKAKVITGKQAVTLAKDMEAESYLYAALLSADHDYWAQIPSARPILRELLALGLQQHRPMLLAAVAHLKPSEVEKLLRLLLNWNVRLTIVGGLGGGTMEEKYAALGQAIRASKPAIAGIAKLAADFVPSDAVFEKAFAEIRISRVALARFYLRELERVAGTEESEIEASPDPAVLTLEHVLPEKTDDGNWPQFTEEEHEVLWNRLGNMALLRKRLNNELKSAAFGNKKKVYKQSKLLLTREIADEKQWKRQQIDSRQLRLAALAAKAWPLKTT